MGVTGWRRWWGWRGWRGLVIRWYWVSMGLYCLYTVRKKVEIWSGVTIAGRTNKQSNKQGKIELLSQWTMEGWDEQFERTFSWLPDTVPISSSLSRLLEKTCIPLHLSLCGRQTRFTLNSWFSLQSSSSQRVWILLLIKSSTASKGTLYMFDEK